MPTDARAREAVRARAPARGDVRLLSRRSLPLALVLALAGGLRLYRFDTLSLWIDEGATAYYARLPWPVVLGLRGEYDPHPPLYYALVKALSRFAPEVVAGRLVSVIAGTLTVIVVYALAARLVNRAAALGTALALATSPLHVWYSQEGRMYALVVLLVALSYLALVAFSQTATSGGGAAARRWAALYGATVLLALYVDYSAVYALTPQLVILLLLAREPGRKVAWLLAAAFVALIGYLPWLPQLVASMSEMGRTRTYLDATPTAVIDSLLALVGLGGDMQTAARVPPTLWARWPVWHVGLLLALVPAALTGTVTLARRSALATATAGGLLLGTIGAAILYSLISPGYVVRTVLAATIGWAILLGAALGARLPARAAVWPAIVTVTGYALALALAVAALDLSYREADKQDYRALAADTLVAPDLPLATMDPVTETLLDLYRPPTLEERFIRVSADPESLRPLDTGRVNALWFAYNRYAWVEDDIDRIRSRLRSSGYELIMHKTYGYPVTLERYARPIRQGSTEPLGALKPGLTAGITTSARTGSR